MSRLSRVSQTEVHASPQRRVIFGSGSVVTHTGPELALLGVERALLIATPSADYEKLSGCQIATMFEGVRPHVPMELVDEVQNLCENHRIDGVVALGGGSTTGLAKALALRSGLPILSIPTTYAGSEMTSI